MDIFFSNLYKSINRKPNLTYIANGVRENIEIYVAVFLLTKSFNHLVDKLLKVLFSSKINGDSHSVQKSINEK